MSLTILVWFGVYLQPARNHEIKIDTFVLYTMQTLKLKRTWDRATANAGLKICLQRE